VVDRSREGKIGNIRLFHESSELVGLDCCERLATTSMFAQVGSLESL